MEAIECLQSRYNRPRLIHKAHVRMILEALPLKEGTGKELRHREVQQHLHALKAMDCEAPGLLKFDSDTMFEWHKHSQESASVLYYNKLLDFINLHAQASEALVVPSKGCNLILQEPAFLSQTYHLVCSQHFLLISQMRCL